MKNLVKMWLLIHSGLAYLNASYHSQYKQDKIINEIIFHRKQEGIFVEIGAYDGIKYSNTKFF